MRGLRGLGRRGLSKRVLYTVLITMGGIVILNIAAIDMLFHRLHQVLIDAEERKENLVEARSEAATMNLVESSLLNTVTWAADQIDGEFGTIRQDFLVLGEQVKDVMNAPDNYNELPVEEPKPENQGEYSLQVLFPEGFDRRDEEMRATIGRLANLGPIMEGIVRENEGIIRDCYITIPDGVTLAMDSMSGDKLENGIVRSYDAKKRPWYSGAVESGEAFFSFPVRSYFYDYDEIVFGVPLYVDGELVAVLEGSSDLGTMQRRLSERNIGKSGFCILVNEKGQLIFSPRENGELASKDEPYDVRESTGQELSNAINHALDGDTGFSEVFVDGKKYYAAYAPIESLDWGLVMFASSEELEEPSQALIADMEHMSDDISDSYTRLVRNTEILMLIMLIVLTLIAQIVIALFLKKTMRPMNLMTEKIQNMTGENTVFKMEDAFRTGDEIQVLGETIAGQSERAESYFREIVKITGERERAYAEMESAAKIQNAMLPKKDGPLYERKEFEIYAEMIPAKQVGGDLYDYFLIDDDHLAVVLGDVSDKGIPAALFMVLVKNTLQSRLLSDSMDLSKMMDEVNRFLIQENAGSMFVTLWIGVLRLSDGYLRFVDAGHSRAAICRKDDIFTIEADEHSVIVGAFKQAKYKVNEMMLEAGDTIYLYTDGITEARNSKGEMFKAERLLTALNEKPTLSCEELDEAVRKHVLEFTNGTEQFDDITTLCFRYTNTI